MNPTEPAVTLLLGLFLVVIAVAIATRYMRIPYTVGLVIAGLLIGIWPRHVAFALTPDLTLVVFLPPLLFAGAWTLPLDHLRKHWLPIALFATAGVLIAMVVARIVLVAGPHFAPATAWLFGAIVAATDPIAVMGIFRALRVNAELGTILEGESLFNDAAAVLAFKITLLTSLAGFQDGSLSPLVSFVTMSAGGVAIGLALGIIALLLLRLTDDYLIEATSTLVVAYGAYLTAEHLRVSGLLAVIVAGLLLSRIGERFGSFSATRQSVNQFWELIAFLSNSLLFLLVGLSINLGTLYRSIAPALWGVGVVAVSRFLGVYGLSWLSALFGHPIPRAWQHLLVLGGLRGALSMALALSLPYQEPNRELLIAMVFAVVLFTIVIQGLGIRPAIARLGLAAAP